MKAFVVRLSPLRGLVVHCRRLSGPPRHIGLLLVVEVRLHRLLRNLQRRALRRRPWSELHGCARTGSRPT